MNLCTRALAVVTALFALPACPSHSGDLSTLHANDVMLGREGMASFPTQANRCPGPNPDGEYHLGMIDGGLRYVIEGHRNTTLSGDTRVDWSEAFALVPSLET